MKDFTDEDRKTDEWYEAHLQEVWAETGPTANFWGAAASAQ